MKLLLDENLSLRLIPFFQHDYAGSSQVVLLGGENMKSGKRIFGCAQVWRDGMSLCCQPALANAHA